MEMFHILGVLAILGAVGILLSKSHVWGIFCFLLLVFCVCGFLGLLGLISLGALTLSLIGGGALFLLQTVFLMNLPQADVYPVRIWLWRILWAIVPCYGLLFIAHKISVPNSMEVLKPVQIGLSSIAVLATEEYGLLLFLVMVTALLVFICSLLLNRREPMMRAGGAKNPADG